MVYGISSGNCTITVSVAAEGDYLEGSAICAVKVESEVPPTIADILAAGPANSASVKALVMAVNGSNIIIGDSTGVMLVYKSSSGLAVGDSASFEGKTKMYNGVLEFDSPTVTKASTGNSVNYGAAYEMTEANISADSLVTKIKTAYIHIKEYLPDNGTTLSLGSYSINLYGDLTGKYSKCADIYGYVLGVSGTKFNVLATEITPDENVPYIAADTYSKTWAYDAIDTVTIKVSSNVNWTYEASGMGWANIDVDGDEISVSPKEANDSSSALSGTITVMTNSTPAVTKVISFSQKASASKYVLDNAAIKSAHTSSWTYSSGEKIIIAADKSTWKLFNTFANKDQVTIQMNKGKSCYILTPEVPEGKKIINLKVEATYAADGKNNSEVTRTFDVLSGSTTIISDKKGSVLKEGIAISGNHRQLKIIPNETTAGACYILSIEIEYN